MRSELHKIISLLKTEDQANVDLGLALLKGQSIDISLQDLKKLAEIEITNMKYFFYDSTLRIISDLLSAKKITINTPDKYGGVMYKNSQLQQIPKAILLLQGVTSVEIQNGKLKALPDEIGELKEITSIRITNTKMSKLPDSITKLNKLKRITITENVNFTTLPEKIGDLAESLEVLELPENNIRSLPKSIAKLKNLRILYLVRNKIARSEIQFFVEKLPNCKISY